MQTSLLERQRDRLDRLDRQLLRVLARRASVIARIGAIKRRRGIPVLQSVQISRRLALVRRGAAGLGLSPAFAVRLYRLIIAESMRLEKRG